LYINYNNNHETLGTIDPGLYWLFVRLSRTNTDAENNAFL